MEKQRSPRGMARKSYCIGLHLGGSKGRSPDCGGRPGLETQLAHLLVTETNGPNYLPGLSEPQLLPIYGTVVNTKSGNFHKVLHTEEGTRKS